MAWSLNFQGGAIQIPKITFTGDFSVTLKATQQANGRFFCGGDNTSGSIEIYRNNSGIVALYIGTVGQFSGTTVLSTNVDVPDTIVVARTGTSVTVRVNGTLQGTTTFSGNMHISWFGLRQGWANYPAAMRFYSCDMQDLVSPSNSRYYDPSLSGGTGNTLPTTAGTNAGTQFNSWPTDDSEWVFYASSETPFNQTILKSSLTLTKKSPSITLGNNLTVAKSNLPLTTDQLNVSAGFSLSTNKSNLTKLDKQLSVRTGTILGVGKRTLVLSPKSQSNILGYVSSLNKSTIPYSVNQLEIVVGSNLPFIGSVLKSTYPIDANVLSFNGGVSATVNKQSLPLSTKALDIITGTNIPVNVGMVKRTLPLNSKQLDVTVGTNLAFNGNVVKSSLALRSKVLDTTLGQHLDIIPRHVVVSYKLLQWVDSLPVLSFEPSRTFVLKNDNTVYVLSNTNNIFTLPTSQNIYYLK